MVFEVIYKYKHQPDIKKLAVHEAGVSADLETILRQFFGTVLHSDQVKDI